MTKNTLYKTMTAGLDERATAENAAAAIVQYPSWRARATVDGLRTGRLDGMPRGTAGGNVNESRITEGLDFAERVRVADGILASMRDLFPDYPYADLIKYLYCVPLQTHQAVAERLGYGETWLYMNRSRALCVLAVLWPTDWETLTVMKGQ